MTHGRLWRFRLGSIRLLFATLLLFAAGTPAQEPEAKRSTGVYFKIDASQFKERAGLRMRADKVERRTGEVTLTGNASLQTPDVLVRADRIVFRLVSQEAEAEGNVRITLLPKAHQKQ